MTSNDSSRDVVPARELYRFPTTFSQRQLWYVQATAPENTAYNIPFAFGLRGSLDLAALQRALATVVARHDALRTHFEVHGEAVRQVVDMQLEVPLERIDLSALAPAEREAARQAEEQRLARHVFDLAQPPLLVLRLLALGEAEHVLLVCVHHIVMDHLSVLQFGRELEGLYADYRAGRRPAEPAEGLHYPDYAVWQEEALDEAAITARQSIWTEALAGFPHQLELPTDHPRPPLQSFEGGEAQIAFSEAASRALRSFAQREQQTLFTVVLAALSLLLRGYTGQDRLVLGCPFANRGAEELEQVMGLFMNLLPVAVAVEPQQGFAELVRGVRRQMMRAQGAQDTPFEKIVQALGVQRDPSRNPLVQAWFTFQDAPMALALDGLEVDSRPLPNGGAKLDLSFWFWDDGARIRGLIEYDRALFERETVERLGQRLEALLLRAVEAPQAPVSGLSLVAPEEQAALESACRAGAPVQDWRSPHGPFYARLAQGDWPALEAADGEWSAARLAARADAIAEALQAAGVRPGDVIGVCMERRGDLLGSVLGVLRVGAAYLPLDPELPSERIAYMLEDSGAGLSLVDAASAARVQGRRLDVAALPAAPTASFVPVPENPAALAYLIYTSGSTGRPKGVRLPCAAVGNFLASMAERPGLAADQRLLALTTYAFDIAVLELFLPLAVGGTVVLGERSLLESPEALASALVDQRIDLLQATPSTWRLLRAHDWPGLTRLMALTGGEALSPELAAWLQPRVAALWNMYGPTETTVWSSLQQITAADTALCPIGLPLARTGLHVVDACGNPLPAGLPGELWITGAGLAEGYHQRPELDADRFVELAATGERAYRTGDIALRMADGRLRHLGRRDHQVKIRGYRIELGEIETVLAALPGVAAAAVGDWRLSDADHRLLAWVVPAEGAPLEAVALRAGLSERLPAYMLPQHFLMLEALPLLPNGKLDRKALPWPSQQAAEPRASAPAPGLGHEQQLVLALARELLGSEGVAIEDNFFEAGGHSLLALSLAARLEKASGVRLSLLVIAHSSLSAVAELVAAGGEAEPAREAGGGLRARMSRWLRGR
ncbi:MAG: amino acid adenylation domain-containing protein [Aquimonas sp.]|nr:amino acid adenylation domain-containing protein [Aquimonas sp.]